MATLSKARNVGDTKVGKDGITRVWKEIKPGVYDWRKVTTSKSAASGGAGTKAEKLKEHLKNSSVEQLRKFASNEANEPTLRKVAHAELESRGEDVSDIDLNTGRVKKEKEMFGADGDDDKPKGTADKIDGLDEDLDWENTEEIKAYLGLPKKMTKQHRIELDNFIYELKIKSPEYIPPAKEVQSLNKTYAQFLSSGSPLMIASGGAGVGKSYNFHAVAKYMNLEPFDPAVHGAGADEDDEDGEYAADDSYDYYEAPEVDSVPQFAKLLQAHNGKVIVFDDSDMVIKNKDIRGLFKKATASSGKRIVGKKSLNENANVDPFEFTGQILLITNMSQDDFVKDEHMRAIYSRGLKKDIQFTKREKLEFIDKLKYTMPFTGVDPLPDKEANKKEREEVYKVLADNIDNIDPDKFSSRSFKEALETKRSIDQANAMIAADPVMGKTLFGEPEDWEKEVKKFLIKGIKPEIGMTLEKALEELDLMK